MSERSTSTNLALEDIAANSVVPNESMTKNYLYQQLEVSLFYYTRNVRLSAIHLHQYLESQFIAGKTNEIESLRSDLW